MSLLVGVDAGTTSLKVGLFDDSGTELAATSEEYSLRTPQPSRAELDAELYWSSLVGAVRRALAEAGAGSADVEAVAVSSQGETVIPVSATGTPLGPAIVWLDNRAVAEARELAERLDPRAVYAATGVPSVVPTWTACKLLWWKRHDPDLFRGAAHFLLVEEFLLHRLTGRFVTEAGVQSTSLLYDIAHHTLWQPVLDLIGISSGRLGELVTPGSVVGSLLPDAAESLGLSTRVMVIAGGMDQGAGAVGVGNFAPGVMSESTGGALAVQASIDRPDGDVTRQTPVYVHSAPNTYLYCPVSPTGGMALTWFRDRFGQPELIREQASDGDAYDLLTRMASQVPPGADGLTMLPHLSGAFSPEYEPAARGVYFGFTLGHRRDHFVRATLEAVAFVLRRNIELLSGIGAVADEVRSHGGGARSSVWNQIKADVCDLPVVTLYGAEAAVRGDALLAGVASGAFRDLSQACQATLRFEARFEPDATTRSAYETAYARYIQLFDTVRPLFLWADEPVAATDDTNQPAPVGHDPGRM
jgi:xylulokinase